MSNREARWADGLLQRVRAVADPRAGDAERNLAGIERRLGLGAPPGASGTPHGAEASGAFLRVVSPPEPAPAAPQPSRAIAGRTSSVLARSAGAGRWLAFGAASAFLGYLVGRSESVPGAPADSPSLAAPARALEAPPAQVLPIAPPPAPSALSAAGPPAPSAPAVRHAARPSRAPRSAAGAEPAATAARGLALREAIELLRNAEAALRRGEAFDASLLLSDLDRRAPAELLREERLATETLVACALGDTGRARGAAQALEHLNTTSIYRGRLAGSCAAPEENASPESKTPPAPH